MNFGDHDRSLPLAVVGLGNPGPQYIGTRHNVGYAVADLLNAKLSRTESHFAHGADLISGHWKWRRTHLLKPNQFMNLSGEPVRQFLIKHEMKPGQLLVVLDDIDLPLGTLRIRAAGSSGGHRGLEDIISALGSDRIARCRIGVGRPEGDQKVPDHVLERPEGQDAELLVETLEKATKSVLCWLVEGVSNAARRYNGPLADEGPESSVGSDTQE